MDEYRIIRAGQCASLINLVFANAVRVYRCVLIHRRLASEDANGIHQLFALLAGIAKADFHGIRFLRCNDQLVSFDLCCDLCAASHHFCHFVYRLPFSIGSF